MARRPFPGQGYHFSLSTTNQYTAAATSLANNVASVPWPKGPARARQRPYPFTLHLGRQPALLLLQGPQKNDQPRLPVRSGGAESALRLAQRKIIALFAVLDHAFQRTVGHIGISGLQQQKRGEHTA